jgi:tol-pal system protein YbgF
MTTMRAENHRLSEQIVELRADHRAQDRKIRDLEHQLAMSLEKVGVTDMPPLPVEVVTPPTSSGPTASRVQLEGDARVVGVADDGGEIIYEGDAAAGRVASITGGGSVTTLHGDDHLDVTHHIPPMSARASRSHVRDAAVPNDAAAADYRAAVELVKAGKHADAQVALRAFIKTYPRHDYADNAQYWLGEDFYAQRDFTHALTEFRATIETYPRGNKVPDALLKVGYCYQALGQADKARAVLEQVVSLYPKSEPAALASKRLETP